ncbi:velvet factor-domain-containing protein [Sporodiniella umbellata]|nr:velvet factor-domain-containing protein [Sporodiniella umbellata]
MSGNNKERTYNHHQGHSKQGNSLNTNEPPINYPLDFFCGTSQFPLDQTEFSQEEHNFLHANYDNHPADPFGLGPPHSNYMSTQDANELMSTPYPASDFYTQQSREEQDIFSELIDLAHVHTSPPPIDTKNTLDRFYQPSSTKTKKNSFQYDLKIVQQPSRARMCGFGDKDRRPIVPAPILRLSVKDTEGNPVDPENFDVTFLVVMCDSCLQTGEPATSASNVSRVGHSVPVSQVVVFSSSEDDRNPRTSKLKNLVGSSVVSANKLYDLENKLGIFFVFHDISLRTEGTFRLKFSLVNVGMPHEQKVNTNELSHVIQVVYSDPFTVYTAKKYPGVVQASPLSIRFAQQGIKISVRKDPSGLKNKQNTSGWLYNDDK